MLKRALRGIFLGLVLASPALAVCTGSNPTWSCPANSTDITNLINGTGIGPATAGSTINVASGTIPSLSVTLNGIQMLGAGSSSNTKPTSTSGTIIQAGTITLTKHATYNSRVSGFSFTGTDNHISAGGTSSNKPYLIDRNYIFSNGGEGANRMLIMTANGGVVFLNTIVASGCTNCGQDMWNIQTDETWTDGTETLGNADTTGERNIYIEGNWIEGIAETAPDCDARSRVVIRYNNYKDASIVCHSGYETTAGYADTTQGGGVYHYEVYGNRFERVSNSIPLNKWFWMRGATGVFANNAVDRSSSPDGSSYPNKPDLPIGTNCNGQSYPIEHQPGQITKVPDATPNKPILVFGNVAGPNTNGTADSNFISVGANNSGGFSCSNPTNYIQASRDYYTSNQWSWVPYTCPHPLAGSGTCATVSSYLNAGTAGYTLSGASCGTPTKLLFSAQPASTILGASVGTITVGIYDSSNVLCVASTDTITLAKTGGSCTGMTLNGTVSGAASSGAFTTTNVNLTVATGACTLTATASGLTSAVSNSFTISSSGGTGGGIGTRVRINGR